MTTTCLINNFNYARFVGEAIDGALRQTVPFDEIIVVDDGSTDGSLEMLKQRYGDQSNVSIIGQANQGQLSCFNAGFARATGDLLFFLDADDVYEPDYLEEVLQVFRRHHSCDFVHCGRRLFGQQDGISLAFPTDRDHGYSVIRTALLREWIGGSTSCLSMRRQVLAKILPLPFTNEWRIRADDCLVFGASLAGARKRYLAKPLVRYRVHEENRFRGQQFNRTATYRRRLAINRLFEYLERELTYNVSLLADFPHREFQTIERPTFNEFLGYLRISLGAPVSLVRRIACIASVCRHFLSTRGRGGSDAPGLHSQPASNVRQGGVDQERDHSPGRVAA